MRGVREVPYLGVITDGNRIYYATHSADLEVGKLYRSLYQKYDIRTTEASAARKKKLQDIHNTMSLYEMTGKCVEICREAVDKNKYNYAELENGAVVHAIEEIPTLIMVTKKVREYAENLLPEGEYNRKVLSKICCRRDLSKAYDHTLRIYWENGGSKHYTEYVVPCTSTEAYIDFYKQICDKIEPLSANLKNPKTARKHLDLDGTDYGVDELIRYFGLDKWDESLLEYRGIDYGYSKHIMEGCR